MRRILSNRALWTGAIFLLVASEALADIFPVGIGDFSGTETIITFSELPPGAPVNGTYLGQGVIFGFGLFAANEPDTATNSSEFGQTNLFPVEFVSAVPRVGFDVKSDDGTLLELNVFDTDGRLIDSAPFLIGPSYTFVGIGSSTGITDFWIQFPGILSIQNFRFEVPQGEIPEPSSVVLAGTAALVVVWRMRGHASGRSRMPWRGLFGD